MVIYDLIYSHLKDSGFDVYAPNTHKGQCAADYIVVKETTRTKYQNFSTTITFYDVLCYSPTYTGALALAENVGHAMRGIEPDVMPTYNKTEPFYDDTVIGYMASIEYRNYKKIV